MFDLQAFPAIYVALFCILGLLVGSFLNVVIHRLPQVLERDWQREAQLALAPDDAARELLIEKWQAEPKFSIAKPRSRCPHCGHEITWYENLPLLSWLGLKGKCSSCKNSISIRYPLVEIVTGALFAYCAWRFGWTWSTLAWCGFCAALVSLTMIDFDTMLLPDDITLPLLWAGLLLSALSINPLTTLNASVWGAIVGYLSLWSVYWLFKIVTGREGMGYGDFKLLAALGAWLGVQAILPIVLLSSVVGAVIGLILKASKRIDQEFPFGPYLTIAGLLCLMIGSQTIMAAVYRWLGTFTRLFF